MREFMINEYHYVELFFIIYLLVYSTFLIISVFVGTWSLYIQRKKIRMYNFIEHEFYVPISIIVPAHNEDITICDTIDSLLGLVYKKYEIIVVDDGSTDDTAMKVIEAYNLIKIDRPIHYDIECKEKTDYYVSYDHKVPISLVIKENGGKADSLNMGINVAEYPYVVCMDADSILQKDALENIARPVLEEKNVIAVGGIVRIVNGQTFKDGLIVNYHLPKNILLCMQILEYDRSFLASRLLFDKFNGNLIISGAFGLFKKETLIEVGGYDSSTIGEDMELVVRLHAYMKKERRDYRIAYASNAVCWSQAPETFKDLLKQRKRWHIGLFQSLFKNKKILASPEYGLVSVVSFLYFLIYELFSPFIEVFGVITMILASIFGLINIKFMILFFALYALFNILMSLTAFFSRIYSMQVQLTKGDVIKAISISAFENIGMRTILAYTRMMSIVKMKGNKNSWGTIQRQKIK